MADDRSTRRHLATVFVAMWSRVQEWSRGRGLTWNENIQLINIHNFNIGQIGIRGQVRLIRSSLGN